MSNTDRDSMLERWAIGMEKLEQYYEGKYGPPATPPSLPPITTYDAMLEAIADGMERAKRNINKKSTTYHSDSVAYVKTVPAGNVHYASLEQIGGRTLVWNQQYQNTMARNNGTYSGVTLTRTDNGFTITGSLPNSNNLWLWGFTPTSGHKYFIGGCPVSGNVKLTCLYSSGYASQANGFIISPTASTVYVAIQCSDSQEVFNLTWTPMLIDLTLLYGSGNEPTSVAEFTAQYPAQYYQYTQGELVSAGVISVISKDADNTTLQTVSIPAEVQALEGYGWSAGSVYNCIDYEAKKFIQNVGSRAYASGDESDSTVITDMTTTYYPLNPAVETDISAYLTDDNLIEVESGGTLTFPNSNGDDYRIPVPSSETFVVGEP